MPIIRHATPGDLPALVSLESACFPPAEAATREALSARLAAYPNHFWLLFSDSVCGEGATLVSFVDGFCTDCTDLEDWMYEEATGHDESGRWQMIFGVNTHPAYRRRGFAGALLRTAIEEARTDGRAGLVLTCKQALIPWYASFGFACEGLSASVHGAVSWYQMRLTF